MELSRTRELLPLVIWRERSPSTNAELRDLMSQATPGSAPLPHGTLLATANQTAGRGRLDRGWVTPPDSAIAASLLLRGVGERGLGAGWMPLLAGSAVASALQPFFREGYRVGVKWPNDVHVRDEEDAAADRPGLKLCGILCEMLPNGAQPGVAIVVGTGINLFIPEQDLPTERATSLLAAGADVGGATSLADPEGRDLADRVLAAYAREMLALVDLASTNPAAARARVARHSLTMGCEVRVHLPGGEIVDGRARELAEDGSLIVDRPTGGRITVSAGDVEHLR